MTAPNTGDEGDLGNCFSSGTDCDVWAEHAPEGKRRCCYAGAPCSENGAAGVEYEGTDGC